MVKNQCKCPVCGTIGEKGEFCKQCHFYLMEVLDAMFLTPIPEEELTGINRFIQIYRAGWKNAGVDHEEIKKLREQQEKLTALLVKAEEKLREAGRQIQALKWELEQKHRQLAAAEDALRRQEEEINILRAECRQREEKNKELSALCVSYQNQIAALGEKLRVLREDHRKLKKENDENKAMLAKYKDQQASNTPQPVSGPRQPVQTVEELGQSAIPLDSPIHKENGFVIKGTTLVEYTGDWDDVVIPEGITKIADKVFYSPYELFTKPNPRIARIISITLPGSLREVGERAFYNCENLIRINFTRQLTRIGRGAFGRCRSLTTVTMLSGDRISEETFAMCTNLQTVVLPVGIQEIGASAFAGCGKLASIKLSGGLREIGSAAFQNCASINTLILPGSLRRIRASAFEGCTGLTQVTIPPSVELIEERAFWKSAIARWKCTPSLPAGCDAKALARGEKWINA